MREFGSDDFAGALELAFGAHSEEELLNRQILRPGGVGSLVAIEAARELAAETAEEGATACICGLLVGAWLPPPEHDLLDRILDGIATVRSFGRHAVIARRCDLAAVAGCERVVARAIGGASDLAPASLQLFEIGFAIALASRQA
ncbi:MAG TPA: hypothetical protein VHC67_11830 [Gaiellaceae bacterium]|nr:hypothetical protein [Gaiellaceae bacterium]